MASTSTGSSATAGNLKTRSRPTRSSTSKPRARPCSNSERENPLNSTPAAELPAFLAHPHKHHFIDGKSVPSLAGERIDTFNPATGQRLATLARGRQADVDVAVA